MSIKSKKNYWIIIGSILALLAFIAASSWNVVSKWFSDKTPTKHYDLIEFKKEVKSLQNRYDARNRELFEEFCSDIATAGDSDFETALVNINSTVAHFGKFNNCCHLIFTMARDKIKKTEDTNIVISKVLQDNVINPCAAGTVKATDILNNFIHRLHENDNLFRSEVAMRFNKIPQESENWSSAQKFVDDLNTINGMVKDLAMTKTFTAIGTAIEVVMIRQTLAMLARVAGKVVGKVVGSATAALLDGPLPIGDIIGIIGCGWCLHDIYLVMKVLPQKMSDTLHKSITDYQRSLHEELLTAGRKAWNLSNESSLEVVKAVK